MKKSFRYIALSFVILLGLSAPQAFAGNKDRSGQAGASELLINPWAASSGWGNAGMSFVHGVEAIGFKLHQHLVAAGQRYPYCLLRCFGSRG